MSAEASRRHQYALSTRRARHATGEFQHAGLGREPLGEGIGPFSVRGGPAGMIVRHGYIVAEWGDTRRVDMTYSVTKSFLSTSVGLAWDDGLIGSLDDTVREYMAPVDVPPGDGEPGVDRIGFGKPDPTTLFESEDTARSHGTTSCGDLRWGHAVGSRTGPTVRAGTPHLDDARPPRRGHENTTTRRDSSRSPR